MSETHITRREAIGGIAGLVLAGCAGESRTESAKDACRNPAEEATQAGFAI